jgi:release factor glutamine methyltransferase
LTVRAALARAADSLARRGVPGADVDAELLLAHVLAVTRTQLALERAKELSEAEAAAFDRLVERRGRREPLAYVLGEWGFRRLMLRTDRRALVPRPETEVVVERCLALIRDLREPRVLDLGTGSGAIALAIADEHPGARVTAVDSSSDALALARENLERTRLADRVELVEADFEAGLPGGPYDLVVANPPYVPADEVEGLEPEVHEWEPRGAIVDRGQSALIERLARDLLAPGGALVLEAHWNGAAGVAERLTALGYHAITITSDLAGVERVVEARRP